MLKLLNITKDYVVGNTTVNALKGVSLTFRKNEFVAILGASGCGKTTLLNIVGGLDKYSSGDLVINQTSTKKYKSKDWDAYRNHSIGFVFQSYNLIGHLTILRNVELALTLSGIGRKERKMRAIEALASVGLEEQILKNPNQLSGGQMQRVAIARALVNNPAILLADEPTGALDSKTSVQIMDILKEISKDRLIIMVTHNPEIADEYSTRIVKLHDGEVIDDSNPFVEEATPVVALQIAEGIPLAENLQGEQVAIVEPIGEVEPETKKRKAKKTDTEKKEAAADLLPNGAVNEMVWGEITSDRVTTEEPAIVALENDAEADGIANIENRQVKSKSSKKRAKQNQPKTAMSYGTALSLSLRNLMTKKARTIITAIAGSIGILGIALVLSISNGFNIYIGQMEASILTNQPVSIQQTTIDLEEMQNTMMDNMLSEKDKYPSDGLIRPYNNSSMANIASYTNNLSPTFIKHMQNIDSSLYRSIDILRNLTFHVLAKNTDGSFLPMEVMANGSTSGIMSMFSGGDKKVSFNQLVSNKDYVLEHYDLLGGSYPSESNEIVLVLDSYNRVSADVLGVLGYKSLTDSVQLNFNEILNDRNTVKLLSNNQYFFEEANGLYGKIKSTSANLQNLYDNSAYELKISGIMRVKPDDTSTMLSTGLCFQEGIASILFEEASISAVVRAQTARIMREYNQSIEKQIFTSILTGNELSLTNISDLININFSLPSFLGVSIPGLAEVSAINIYPSNLDAKEKIIGAINDWNTNNVKIDQIKYTDAMSFMFANFETMLSAITYILIAFVAISLIVSTVMIGIITYVSVIERTKEIGILRAIGARKKDISRVFNAESLSIGFSSGFIGIFVTWLLLFPINAILKHFTDIPGLAVLNFWHALILLGISMLLTFISGLIPSRIASKKDPIQALRSD